MKVYSGLFPSPGKCSNFDVKVEIEENLGDGLENNCLPGLEECNLENCEESRTDRNKKNCEESQTDSNKENSKESHPDRNKENSEES